MTRRLSKDWMVALFAALALAGCGGVDDETEDGGSLGTAVQALTGNSASNPHSVIQGPGTPVATANLGPNGAAADDSNGTDGTVGGVIDAGNGVPVTMQGGGGGNGQTSGSSPDPIPAVGPSLSSLTAPASSTSTHH